MPARLTVIMVQTTPPEAAAQRLSESIVGELIGRPGIDMTLVESLSGLAADSTDRLTLDSLTGDVAALDWQAPEAIVQSLAALGVAGHRSPHRADPDAPPPRQPTRRIYAFDLRQFSRADAVCSALQELLASRQVRTVSLDNLLRSPAPNGSPTSRTPEDSPPRVNGSPNGTGTAKDNAAAVDPKPPASAGGRQPEDRSGIDRQEATPPASAGGQPPQRTDLDDLVDRLDELDP